MRWCSHIQCRSLAIKPIKKNSSEAHTHRPSWSRQTLLELSSQMVPDCAKPSWQSNWASQRAIGNGRVLESLVRGQRSWAAAVPSRSIPLQCSAQMNQETENWNLRNQCSLVKVISLEPFFIVGQTDNRVDYCVLSKWRTIVSGFHMFVDYSCVFFFF